MSSALEDAASAVEADGATTQEQAEFDRQAACEICSLQAGATGSDMIFEPNAAALSAHPVAGLQLGQLAWVGNEDLTSLSFRDYFRYEPDSPYTPDGVRFIAPASGPGNWVRLYIPDAFWKSVAEWFIDPGNVMGPSSDENPGTSITLPLRTWAELMRRVTGTTNRWLVDGAFGAGDEVINPVVRINSPLLADDSILVEFWARSAGATLLVQPSPGTTPIGPSQPLGPWVSNNGLTYTITAVTAGNPGINTVPSITLDHVTVTGETYYDEASDQIINIRAGAAAGNPVVIDIPTFPFGGGEPLIRVDPKKVIFITFKGSSFVSNPAAGPPGQAIQATNLTMGPVTTSIDAVEFENAGLTSCVFVVGAASEPAMKFLDCAYTGCTLRNAVMRGGCYMSRGAIGNCYWDHGANSLVVAQITDTLFVESVGSDPCLQISSGGRVVLGGDTPVYLPGGGINVFTLEPGAVLDTRGTVYGVMGVGGFVLNAAPRSVTIAPAGLTWCTIAGTRINALNSATNLWQPQPTSNAVNTPTFAALTTFASLFAGPFNGWAKHPFTECLISNGS